MVALLLLLLVIGCSFFVVCFDLWLHMVGIMALLLFVLLLLLRLLLVEVSGSARWYVALPIISVTCNPLYP